MPTQLRKHRKWLVIAAAVLLTATPSFALFGLGDIVFDPTSYASLIQQLTTLQTQYNMLKNNITHFSLKQQWQTTLHTLENANVANMFGETAGIKIALNTNSPSTSTTAWKTATVSMNSGTSSYLAGTASRQRAHVATRHDRNVGFHLSRLPHSSGPVPDQQNRELHGQFLAPFGQFDISSGTNSEVQQLNLLNAAEAQKLSEMQSQGTLHPALPGR